MILRGEPIEDSDLVGKGLSASSCT